MGGGHGPHIEANPNNIKEEDADLSAKIRPIELIKHNPQVFHLEFFSMANQYEILGGAKTMFLAGVGGSLALAYTMYYCSYCHLPLDRGWQYWSCLGTRKFWDDPPGIWYYEDELGNYWVTRCRACYAFHRLQDVAIVSSDDD